MCETCERVRETISEGLERLTEAVELAAVNGPTDEMLANLKAVLATGRTVNVPVLAALSPTGMEPGGWTETLRWHAALARLEQSPVWTFGAPGRTYRLTIQEANGWRVYAASIVERGA